MKKINDLMLATDFSSCADNALDYAAMIARASQSKLILLNVFEVPVMAPVNVFTTLEDTVHVVTKEMRTSANTNLRKRQASLDDLSVDVQIAEGNAAQVIKEQVHIHQPDLLLMGTRGASANRGLFMGSTAAAVMREAACPLLAVPQDARATRISRVAYATDLKYDETDVLEYLVKFAAMFNAEVVILHIDRRFAESEWSLDLMQDLKANVADDKMIYREVVNDDVLEGINDFVKEGGVDLLATTTSNTSFFERLMFKSVTRELLMHSEIPMMVFNRKKHDLIFFT